jgi:hypothetical protein
MQEMWALFAVYQAVCRIVGIAVNAAGVPPAQISFPHALAAAKDSVAAFSPNGVTGFRVRDRPDRNSPRKSRKAGDFPARKPGEPSVVRKIEFHLLSPWQAT